MKINLMYFWKTFSTGGGAITYAAHLHRGLVNAGHEPIIWRVTGRNEGRARPVAHYGGLSYVNVGPDEAEKIVSSGPSVLMSVGALSYQRDLDDTLLGRLVDRGMRITIHDVADMKIYDALGVPVVRPFCIRPAVKKTLRDAVVVDHPYDRYFAASDSQVGGRRWLAACPTRITYGKRIELIMEANRLLEDEQKVRLIGDDIRIYTMRSLMPKYPEYVQSGRGYKPGWGAGAQAVRDYSFSVDMTYFPHDGGGSQYTFLEAWDAGTVCVIHQDWLRYAGEMEDGRNCLAVENAEHLASEIRAPMTRARRKHLDDVARGGRESLVAHDPTRVARKIARELAR